MAPKNAERQLDVEDALAYLDRVKHEFRDTPEKYTRFLDIMKRFKAGQSVCIQGNDSSWPNACRIDTPQAVAQISELFEGRTQLIEGFNVFLPPGYHIDSSPSAITTTTPSTQTTHAAPSSVRVPDADEKKSAAPAAFVPRDVTLQPLLLNWLLNLAIGLICVGLTVWTFTWLQGVQAPFVPQLHLSDEFDWDKVRSSDYLP